MSESRDANDPRDALRALRKEARSEFDEAEAGDSGGQEHASERDREGVPGRERTAEARASGADRATRAKGDADRLRVPRGDPATGAGGDQASGPTASGPGEPHEK